MELRQVRYFLAVAETGSVRRAADVLHIAAPSISVQIQHLEAEMRAQLFLRDRRRMVLTEAGRSFVEHCRRSLSQLESGVKVARALDKGQGRHLTIGYIPAAIYLGMLKVVPAFRSRWPEVEFSFQSLQIPDMIDALRCKNLDLAFVGTAPTDEFDVFDLVTQPSVVAIPAAHPLAASTAISIKDLSGVPLIYGSREQFPVYRREIEKLFADVGAEINIALELENTVAMVGGVAMGIGCSILPSYAQRFHVDGVTFLPILGPQPPIFPLSIVKRKGESGLVDRFYRFSIEQLAEGET